MYVCVCGCVCMYVCMYLYMYVCMLLWVCVCMCVCVCMYASMYKECSATLKSTIPVTSAPHVHQISNNPQFLPTPLQSYLPIALMRHRIKTFFQILVHFDVLNFYKLEVSRSLQHVFKIPIFTLHSHCQLYVTACCYCTRPNSFQILTAATLD